MAPVISSNLYKTNFVILAPKRPNFYHFHQKFPVVKLEIGHEIGLEVPLEITHELDSTFNSLLNAQL